MGLSPKLHPWHPVIFFDAFGSGENKIVEKDIGSGKTPGIGDLNSLCPLVVARLPLITNFDVADLVLAATGPFGDAEVLRAAVHQTMLAEKLFWKKPGRRTGSLSIRFFENALERSHLRRRIKDYDPCNGPVFLLEEGMG